MKIDIIGACQTLGCGKDGVQYGPNSIRQNGLLNRLKIHNIDINDIGDIHNNDEIVCQPNPKLKNYEPIADFCERLAQTVHKSFQYGNFPLVLGGDHSLGIGSVCGAARAFGDDICIIWIDAHTDINTQDTSPTGNIHGMTLASALGMGNEQLSSICGKGQKIKAKNIIYIASRDIDKGEADIIKQNGITVFHMDNIISEGVDNIVERIGYHISNMSASKIYLSIDIDVIDPKIAPGTGVPVSNGINVETLLKFIDVIARTGKVKGAELVEVNPTIDDENGTTTLLAINIIEYLITRVFKSNI